MRRVTSIVVVLVEGGRRAAVGIVEHQPDFGDVARGTLAGAGEDHVVHAGGAHVLVGALAHHPAHRLDEIRFAAAVRTDDAGEARLDLEFRRIAKALESGQTQPLELHRRRSLATHARARPAGAARWHRSAAVAGALPASATTRSTTTPPHRGVAIKGEASEILCETWPLFRRRRRAAGRNRRARVRPTACGR